MWIRLLNQSCLTRKVTRKMVTMIAASLPHALTSTKLPSRHIQTSSPLPTTATIIPRRDISSFVRPRADDTPLQPEQQQKQVDLSVLRFTLGIPGLDESYLPRYLGIGFGSLILLNHFLDLSPPTPPQITSEVLGIFLAAFSITLPFIGKLLQGASPVDRLLHPERNKQIFVMSENLSDIVREDLAWESFVMLRNTNTTSVLISVQDALCVRGYWNVPEDASKLVILDRFVRQIQEIGLSDLRNELYFPQSTDQLWPILPKGTTTVLLQPISRISDQSYSETEKLNGFILLVSSASYAYSDKDRDWTKAIARKFLVHFA